MVAQDRWLWYSMGRHISCSTFLQTDEDDEIIKRSTFKFTTKQSFICTKNNFAHDTCQLENK